MKKLLTVACILMCALMLFACADKPAEETQPAATIDVYVTLSNAGDLVVKQEKITVTDLNGDKKFNIDETLAAAHKAKGKAADYASGTKEGYDGVSLLKLWGDESGNFGYYVNNSSAWSLADEVKAGDYVVAFVYKDGWSDSYAYFDVCEITAIKGGEFELTLNQLGYDSNWNTVTLASGNSTIVIDGEKSTFVTDADGRVKLSFENAGTYVLSATSETATLVPPVCIVTVR